MLTYTKHEHRIFHTGSQILAHYINAVQHNAVESYVTCMFVYLKPLHKPVERLTSYSIFFKCNEIPRSYYVKISSYIL